MRKHWKRGFTLIELLCCMCIILILVGLMLGPVMKAFKRAKRFAGEDTTWVLMDRFRDAMEKHFGALETYPSHTADELYAAGKIDSNIRNLLRRKEVKFIPFSSATPDTDPILMIEVTPGNVTTLLKADIRVKN